MIYILKKWFYKDCSFQYKNILIYKMCIEKTCLYKNTSNVFAVGGSNLSNSED
jgi:hypothetical protein